MTPMDLNMKNLTSRGTDYVDSSGACEVPFLRIFPASRQPACDHKQGRRRGHQNRYLWPEVRDWFVTPENFREAIDRPRVDGQQPRLLHGFRHKEPRKHAATD